MHNNICGGKATEIIPNRSALLSLGLRYPLTAINDICALTGKQTRERICKSGKSYHNCFGNERQFDRIPASFQCGLNITSGFMIPFSIVVMHAPANDNDFGYAVIQPSNLVRN